MVILRADKKLDINDNILNYDLQCNNDKITYEEFRKFTIGSAEWKKYEAKIRQYRESYTACNNML
jgi:hypothetical protein